jgi:glycosyltransferase involved in cell wall biosynthesis
VVLNLVQGSVHSGNVVVLSPRAGSMSARFVDCGASIRVGNLSELLINIRDAFLVVCNTIMTADIVVSVAQSSHPVIWLVHEWWTEDMIVQNFSLRSLPGGGIAAVGEAMRVASHIVFVCNSQQQLYLPSAPSSVIHVGVPFPLDLPTLATTCVVTKPRPPADIAAAATTTPVIFLVLGIVCPRKNQMWAVELFQLLQRTLRSAADGDSEEAPSGGDYEETPCPPVQLHIVGARRDRDYEIAYLDQLLATIGTDCDISVFPVTDNVHSHLLVADVLLFPSLNEVTPLVILEAMNMGLPVLTTNVGGIPELVREGLDGFIKK